MSRPAPTSTDSRPTLHVVHVMTVPASLAFLRGQAAFMATRGVRLTAVTSPGPELEPWGRQEGVAVFAVDMPRRVSPIQDLAALARLIRLLRHLRPDLVHAHTPKGGLLGMLAATLAGVPARIYHIRGLPYVAATGRRRALLRTTERISCGLANRVLAVSRSMRDLAVSDGLCAAGKVDVLRGGSGNGVDAVGRFRPAAPEMRRAARREFAIPEDAPVIGFVGRLVREKGVGELAEAWRALRAAFPAAHLLLLGPEERQDPVDPAALAALRCDPRAHLLGNVRDTPRGYAAMDVVALPTYREGFPNVALEAAAMALPIVATAVPGCTDAVVDGATGLLVPARDGAALARALGRYLSDSALRAAHGEAARARVLADFGREGIWEAHVSEYFALARGKPAAPHGRPAAGDPP